MVQPTLNARPGRCVLLLHDLAGRLTNSWAWAKLAKPLYRRGFSVILADLPGCGFSTISTTLKSCPVSFWNAYDSDILCSFLDALGVGRCHMVAIGEACDLVLRMLQRAPHRIHPSHVLHNPVLGGEHLFGDNAQFLSDARGGVIDDRLQRNLQDLLAKTKSRMWITFDHRGCCIPTSERFATASRNPRLAANITATEVSRDDICEALLGPADGQHCVMVPSREYKRCCVEFLVTERPPAFKPAIAATTTLERRQLVGQPESKRQLSDVSLSRLPDHVASVGAQTQSSPAEISQAQPTATSGSSAQQQLQPARGVQASPAVAAQRPRSATSTARASPVAAASRPQSATDMVASKPTSTEAGPRRPHTVQSLRQSSSMGAMRPQFAPSAQTANSMPASHQEPALGVGDPGPASTRRTQSAPNGKASGSATASRRHFSSGARALTKAAAMRTHSAPNAQPSIPGASAEDVIQDGRPAPALAPQRPPSAPGLSRPRPPAPALPASATSRAHEVQRGRSKSAASAEGFASRAEDGVSEVASDGDASSACYDEALLRPQSTGSVRGSAAGATTETPMCRASTGSSARPRDASRPLSWTKRRNSSLRPASEGSGERSRQAPERGFADRQQLGFAMWGLGRARSEGGTGQRRA
mmetsp:Transcript_75020/g.208564  ORF Transcript_75020/g.208564 Transcript_75020/m.208564 type:complete len:646 (+) Transcript_75020:2-1939(+)